MKKFFQVGLLLAAIVSGQAWAAIPQTIRFATEATYPPFEYTDASGQIKGFDIDIAKALCKQMKVNCTFSNQPWDSLIPSLKLGKFDALIGAMAITPERQKQVDFTQPYYAATAEFIAAKNNNFVISPEGLKGKNIGTQGGTTFENFLKAKYPDAKVKTYASLQDAYLDLVAGRVDMVLGDTPMSQEWLKKDNNSKNYAVVGTPVASLEYFGSGYGIAVQQGNTELAAAFNKALADIKAIGTYNLIVRQYFSIT